MNTKKIPAVVSLMAGLIALIITYIRRADTIEILTTLLIVLLSFYVLGSIVKVVIDKSIVEEEPEEDEESEEELENIETDKA